MEEIYFKAQDEIGYRATRFKQMVDINGGLKAAKILLKSKDISYGFEELCLYHRQDLSMEALIVENIKNGGIHLTQVPTIYSIKE